MKRMIAVVGIAASVFLSPLLFAQTATGVIAKGPGVAGAAQTIKVTATITAIDAANRNVTLQRKDGLEVLVSAGPEVKNFAQIKVGDQVNIEYVEALTLELKKGSTAPVARTDHTMGEAAKPGERPGAVGGRQVTVMAEVVALDPKMQVVTLRGPQRTVDLKVADPEQFKRVALGDRVEATYTEAVAVAVEPASK